MSDENPGRLSRPSRLTISTSIDVVAEVTIASLRLQVPQKATVVQLLLAQYIEMIVRTDNDMWLRRKAEELGIGSAELRAKILDNVAITRDVMAADLGITLQVGTTESDLLDNSLPEEV